MKHTSYTDEQLAYFKELIEGQARVSWRAWWNANESTLKKQLSSPEYSRLKFGLVEYAHKLLEANGIKVNWGAPARRESYLAHMHESSLDETGKLKESIRRKSYNGACGNYLDGEIEEGKKTLTKIIDKLRKKESLEAKQELEDMQYDGEMMLNCGVDEEFGQSLLEAVVSYGYGDDLTDYAVSNAEKTLKKLNA